MMSLRPFLLIVLTAMGLAPLALAEDAEIQRLIDNIQNGPSIYRTPEAQQYFAAHPPAYPTTDEIGYDKGAAAKSIRAAIQLGDKISVGPQAIRALIDRYPRVEHVVTLSNVEFTPGHGTFEDWIMTYIVTEKNKFTINSPLVEYSTAAKCEDFVTAAHAEDVSDKKIAKGAIVSATATIYIVLKLNAGQCALTKISGQDLGPDRDAWRRWFESSGGSFVQQSASSSSGGDWGGSASRSGGSSSRTVVVSDKLSDVLVGGKYRMVLSTGDEFVGRIESVNDTNIVFDTEKGDAYSFNKNMVVEHELLDSPRKTAGSQAAGALSFDDLLRQNPSGLKLDVKLSSGATFSGTLASIDSTQLKLNVDGSLIPINKNAIAQITRNGGGSKAADSVQAAPKARSDYDTLYVKNPKKDEYGRALEDLMIVGDIQSEIGSSISFQYADGTKKSIDYSQITRRISHDRAGYSEIERYGKTLICPQNMILVDVPPAPGKANRPFFKVCIDKYEYPNQQGTMPRVNVSFDEAQQLCQAQGKRLCTDQEWRFSCGGLEEYTYPYGWNFQQDFCNADPQSKPEASGLRSKCISKFGVYDMAGNVFEWVKGVDGKQSAMGGSMSKCQTVSPGGGGGPKPQTGLRCCKSN
jgi:hypothetical protein